MLQFTTRLPIPVQLKVGEEDFHRGMKLFPIIGIIIGSILWLSYRFVFAYDPMVAAVSAVLLEIVITGGLHQDGLGDTFDGLFSNTRGERMVAVMKDSRLGAHGVLAIIGVLLLKVSLINAIGNPVALLTMPVLSRLSMVFGAAFSRSAREEGLGHLFIEGVGWKDALFSGILAGVLVFYFIGITGVIVSEIVILIVTLVYIRIFDNRIGGMTGDTLGALEEVCSVAFLTIYPILTA